MVTTLPKSNSKSLYTVDWSFLSMYFIGISLHAELSDVLCELPRTPLASLNSWLGVIQSASSTNTRFLTNLVAALVYSLHQESISTQELFRFGSWIRFLLLEWVAPKASSSIIWSDLLTVVKDNPGPFSAGVMKAILLHVTDEAKAHSAVTNKLLEAAQLTSMSERIGRRCKGKGLVTKVDGLEPYLQECISLFEKVRKRQLDSKMSQNNASAKKKFKACAGN